MATKKNPALKGMWSGIKSEMATIYFNPLGFDMHRHIATSPRYPLLADMWFLCQRGIGRENARVVDEFFMKKEAEFIEKACSKLVKIGEETVLAEAMFMFECEFGRLPRHWPKRIGLTRAAEDEIIGRLLKRDGAKALAAFADGVGIERVAAASYRSSERSPEMSAKTNAAWGALTQWGSSRIGSLKIYRALNEAIPGEVWGELLEKMGEKRMLEEIKYYNLTKSGLMDSLKSNCEIGSKIVERIKLNFMERALESSAAGRETYDLNGKQVRGESGFKELVKSFCLDDSLRRSMFGFANGKEERAKLPKTKALWRFASTFSKLNQLSAESGSKSSNRMTGKI